MRPWRNREHVERLSIAAGNILNRNLFLFLDIHEFVFHCDPKKTFSPLPLPWGFSWLVYSFIWQHIFGVHLGCTVLFSSKSCFCRFPSVLFTELRSIHLSGCLTVCLSVFGRTAIRELAWKPARQLLRGRRRLRGHDRPRERQMERRPLQLQPALRLQEGNRWETRAWMEGDKRWGGERAARSNFDFSRWLRWLTGRRGGRE